VTGSSAGALTPDEIDELLRRPVPARLATLDPDGYPSIVPVWIEWDGSTAWIVARALAAYVANLSHDPRVGLSIVDPDDPDRRVQIRGRATIEAGPGPLVGRTLEIARIMAERHEGPAGLAYIEETRDWPRVLVAIPAEQIRSWGSGNWHHRYLPPASDSGGADPS
jgi:PPOX class probable F420-dependent enzyme